ncbi:MAG: DUF2148 domain-containing protein [Synergistaceae bacterium]|nr:DUF2148 domain-containing protein [Synergistaceae bacterium]
MIYKSDEIEKKAVLQAAELMIAAARTAPKACAVDQLESMILDGAEKDSLTAAMRELAKTATGRLSASYARDAGSLDNCPALVLLGIRPVPRALDCGLCGLPDCAAAVKGGVPCAMGVHDLGIAVGSAAATAMDHRIDNRILLTAGMAALRKKFFSEKVTICFGIGLSVTGKNIFFDRDRPTA